jgi:hypothetical protein
MRREGRRLVIRRSFDEDAHLVALVRAGATRCAELTARRRVLCRLDAPGVYELAVFE